MHKERLIQIEKEIDNIEEYVSADASGASLDGHFELHDLKIIVEYMELKKEAITNENN